MVVFDCDRSSWQAEMRRSLKLIVSQLSQISEFQVDERPRLKKGWIATEEATQGGYMVHTDLDVHTNHIHTWELVHECMFPRVNIYTHACTRSL